MHEMALMAGVFEIISRYTADFPEKRVTKVTLVVGEMTNAVPEALEAAFEVYANSTNVEGAELVIKEIPLLARCTECGREGRIEKHMFVCPACSSLSMEIKSGRELYVDSLEVD
ncbi:MAG: hydrogenase maturation nickel metallochaperone HypA [Firmicutes bacterium HGW-Firmicutes-14]|nr:MAG: hydrogenase maturation nickel metallochaperone HypA [Firmicutes bacterium HGW-Firmicutes-14]